VSKRTMVLMIVGITSIALAVVVSLPLNRAEAQTQHKGHAHMHKMDMPDSAKTSAVSLEKVHSEHLPMLSASIDKAPRP